MKVKSFIFAVFVVVGAFFCNPIKAEATPCKEQQKMYVAAEQININKDCILISVSEEVFGTMRLGKDEKGYYVYANELYTPKGHLYRCPHCSFSSYSVVEYNKHMGKHRSEQGWRR